VQREPNRAGDATRVSPMCRAARDRRRGARDPAGRCDLEVRPHPFELELRDAQHEWQHELPDGPAYVEAVLNADEDRRRGGPTRSRRRRPRATGRSGPGARRLGRWIPRARFNSVPRAASSMTSRSRLVELLEDLLDLGVVRSRPYFDLVALLKRRDERRALAARTCETQT
jgi:hypothetical protein